MKKSVKLPRLLLVSAFAIAAINAQAKDHSAEYQVGYFSSTGQLSDGSYANCSGRGCLSYSAAHNVHYVRTETGMYAIEAPISVGKTLALGMLTDGFSPTVHQQWFMDQLHEGDKILFYAQCKKHNNCVFYLPNPDKAGKEYVSLGYFSPDVAKTNTQTLCGKGKLAPAVEAQVCPATTSAPPPPPDSATPPASTSAQATAAATPSHHN